jgi:Zn-dependent protease
VPVNFNNLRDPKRDSLWVAAAGPASNIVQALVWATVALVLTQVVQPTGLVGAFWQSIAEAGIQVNVVFAILNLFPLLPLDGGRIVTSLLPDKLAYTYSRTEPFGMLILIVLIVSGVLNTVLGPLYVGTLNLIYSAFGLA